MNRRTDGWSDNKTGGGSSRRAVDSIYDAKSGAETQWRIGSFLERFCTVFAAVLFGAVLLFLWWISVTSTCTVYGGNEVLQYTSDSPLLHFFVLTAVLGALIWRKKMGEKRGKRGKRIGGREFWSRRRGREALIRLLLTAAGVYLIWLLLTGYWVGSDQRMAVESGQALIRGDFSPWEPYGFTYSSPMEPRGYAYTYPSQNGLILYFALLAFFFRDFTPYAAQALNIGFLAAGMYCLNLLFEQAVFSNVYQRREGRGPGSGASLVLLLFYLPFTFYFVFVYGTVSGFALSSFALYEEYRFLKNGSWRRFFLSAAAIILAVFLKSNYLIVLVAMVIYLLSYCVIRRRPGFLLAAVLLAGFYTGAGRGVNLFLEAVTSYPVSRGAPMIAWVEMGLREGSRGPGWYNGYNVSVFSAHNLDPEETGEAVKADLKETLTGFAGEPGKAADFFVRKCKTIWAEPTFQSLWIQEVKGDSWLLPRLTESLYGEGGILNTVYLAVSNLFQSLVYAGAFLFAVLYRKRLSWEQLMPALIFIGGFLFHLAWEAKGQYTVCYFVLLIPYAVAGLNQAAVALGAFLEAGTAGAPKQRRR